MKQETIEQILSIAGKQEYSQTLTLSVQQVQAMLEAAYEAGQRDLSFMAKPVHNELIRGNESRAR